VCQQIAVKYLIITLAVAPLALAGCSTKISYSPLPNVNISSSLPTGIPYPDTAKLPGGHGGTKKTGQPYRVAGHTYYPLSSASGYDRTGTASWYGRKFHGRKTANGERYDMYALSAAHRTLPLPTLVRVTNLENGRQAVVRVNDRGPYVKNRLIDLSYAAAQQLGYANKGTVRVRVQALESTASAAMIAHKRRPEATSKPADNHISTPESAIRDNRTAGMYVQLGAFLSRANAQHLRSSLLDRYPNTQVHSYSGSTQTLYRVRIGPFSEPEKIEQVAISLKNDGFGNIIVIIE